MHKTTFVKLCPPNSYEYFLQKNEQKKYAELFFRFKLSDRMDGYRNGM